MQGISEDRKRQGGGRQFGSLGCAAATTPIYRTLNPKPPKARNPADDNDVDGRIKHFRCSVRLNVQVIPFTP